MSCSTFFLPLGPEQVLQSSTEVFIKFLLTRFIWMHARHDPLAKGPVVA